MLGDLATKVQSWFPLHRRKAIEDWDFIMVFQQYYQDEVQMMFKSLKCQDRITWTTIQDQAGKRVLFLIRISDDVVQDMAHELKILKKKDKRSFRLSLREVNLLIYTTDEQKNPSIYNYLCWIRARLAPQNKQIYEQEMYSPFNKKKKEKFLRDEKGNLFTYEQQLRAKYHFLITYSQKVATLETITNAQDTAKEPFNIIMKHPGFLELVPVQRVSQHRSFIAGSIKDYVGPNIDCYFDFVDFMQKWLVFPMIVGVLTVGINSYFEYNADNSPVDFIYALVIMLWSILFITRWEQISKWAKVKQSSGTSEVWTEHQDMISKRNMEKKYSLVTGQAEHYVSFRVRVMLNIASNFLCFSMMFLTLTFIVYSLNARGFIDPDHKLFYSEMVSGWASAGGIFDKDTLLNQIPNIIHVIVTNGFDQNVYRPAVKKLAKLQRHQSRKGYENSIIIKYFIYEFVITFADLFYIAFVRLDIQGLREQLLSLFFIDIVRRVVAESVIPWALSRYRKYKLQNEQKKNTKQLSYQSGWMPKNDELKYGAILQIEKVDYEPFDDYLQIVTNFGYLVMISSCFPLAPLLILIAHGVQSIQDKYKIIHLSKRKLPQNYVGMGRWKNIIVFMCYISIITNIMLFAFSSQQVVNYFPKMYEGGKDLLYGNTDLTTLIGGAAIAATDIIENMIPIHVGLEALGLDNGTDYTINEATNQTITELIGAQQGGQQGQTQGAQQGWQQGKTSIKPPKIVLQQFKPPKKQAETTFIAILFFIEHFFLLLFIFIRDFLAKRKSEADIYRQRKEYKHKIKKNLHKDILNLLTDELVINKMIEESLGNQMRKSINSEGPVFRQAKLKSTISTASTLSESSVMDSGLKEAVLGQKEE